MKSKLRHLRKDPRFSFIAEIEKSFSDAEIFLVGGAVRDAFLERSSKDFDFVVRNVPLAKLQKLLQKIGSVNLVGRTFGVLKFAPTKASQKDRLEPFDIALPRTEFTVGNTGHYRDFAVQTDYRLPIETDLSRRDFTINAIAWDVSRQVLVDPFGGADDIAKKNIRCVGVPSRRFEEDYSRILRALRFACQLNFQIEEKTYAAIKRNIKNINNEIAGESRLGARETEVIRVVPYEIIARECLKSFVADPLRALDLYDEVRAFHAIMPELLKMKGCPQDPQWHSEGDVWTHARLALQQLSSKKFIKEFGDERPTALLVMATLFHDIGKPLTIQTPEKDHVERIHFYGHDRVGAETARAICERLRFSSVESIGFDAETMYWLVKNHLLLLNADVREMKESTLEKYFFQDISRGATLLKLIFADSCATLRADKKTSLTNYRRCIKRIEELKKRLGVRRDLPSSILNGHAIIKKFHIPQGPLIGELLLALREEQLAGRVRIKQDAYEFLKSLLLKKNYENTHSTNTRRKKSR